MTILVKRLTLHKIRQKLVWQHNNKTVKLWLRGIWMKSSKVQVKTTIIMIMMMIMMMEITIKQQIQTMPTK